MSTEISVEREIAAPPEHVWNLISDVTRMSEWSPETSACKWRGSADGAAVGRKFKGTNELGKKRWSTDCTVIAAEPGREFAFRVKAGPFSVADWSYHIEPTATGCTVRETWTDRRGKVATVLGKPVSGVADRAEHNKAGMVATLDGLAAVAESGT
jgi:uncharacterized protein YndB with AHSA1/START domain